MISRRSLLLAAAAPPVVSVRPITRGPKFHWFGYYDKLQFDPSGRYALGMEVDFEHRSPRPEDEIRVGFIDLQDHDRWTEIGRTRAWNWQQGCMLQWIPGSATEVVWNDRRDGGFVSIVRNVKTGKQRILPAPIYCLSPDGRSAVYPDFRRLNDCRPGYGYAAIPDPNSAAPAPADAGIWHLDLRTGKTALIIPLSEIVKVPNPDGSRPWAEENAKNWFNHLLYSTDGKRFIFLHRWRGPKEGKSFATRMFTADADGRNLFVLDPYGKTSHFIWRDPAHVLAWAWHPSNGEKFYLYQDRTTQVQAVGVDVMRVNGHCTYLPGGRWILNDTYPDKDRLQNVYLYEVAAGRRLELGSFAAPPEYAGEWRCDTHPRFSPDGRRVVIDSAHRNGRQMYLIDVSEIA
jgi:hypothetical protein